jgi:hypothetical protein
VALSLLFVFSLYYLSIGRPESAISVRCYDSGRLSETILASVVDYRTSSSLDIYEIDTAVAEIPMIQVAGTFEVVDFKVARAFLADSGFLHNCKRVFDLF